MSPANIRAIIFDFGNILARFDHMKACQRLSQYSPLSPEKILAVFFSGKSAPAKLHEAGRLSPQEFFQAASKVAQFNEHLSFQKFSDLWKDIFQENTGAGDILSALRPDVKRCILSNTDPIHWSAIEQLPVMKRYFSDQHLLVRSYISGTRKPDFKMYQDALACLGLTSKDVPHVLYIDDVAEYRDTFARMGGHVLAYDCSKDPLTQLEAGLKQFDVL